MEETTAALETVLETIEPVVESAAEAASAGIAFEPFNFVSNLQYMGMGMLGIFIVIAAIWGVTVALNKIFSEKPKADADSEN